MIDPPSLFSPLVVSSGSPVASPRLARKGEVREKRVCCVVSVIGRRRRAAVEGCGGGLRRRAAVQGSCAGLPPPLYFFDDVGGRVAWPGGVAGWRGLVARSAASPQDLSVSVAPRRVCLSLAPCRPPSQSSTPRRWP